MEADLSALRGFLSTIGPDVPPGIVLPQLDVLGVQRPEDLRAPTAFSPDASSLPETFAQFARVPGAVTLHPHEIDSLSGVSVAGKIALVTAIGRIDLLEWLKEWGLEPLAAQLDDLGIEEPSHAIDLLPEEIEGLETTPIFKLQLMKAIAHLESETTIVEDTVSRSPPGRPEQAYDELKSQLDGAAQAAQAQVLADNERMKAELEADRAANSTLRQEVARESDFLVKLSQTSEDNRRLVEMAGKVSSAHRNAFSCGRAT